MKNTGVFRRIDELGRIVVPKELRRILGLKEKERVEIFTNENAILIRAYHEEQKDQNTAIVRYIDDFGRIVIPKETRIAFDIKPYDKFDIAVDNDYIILTKSYDKCIFCHSTDNLSLFMEKPVCQKCIAQVKKL